MQNTLIAVLLTIGPSIPPTTYYIDPAGSDKNDGSISAPWKTLSFACKRAVRSGDTIHINAGTYFETTRSFLARGVSIEGEGDNSIIQSHLTTAGEAILNLNSNFENSDGNQHIRNLRFDGDNFTTDYAVFVNKRGNVSIYNCTFLNFNKGSVTFIGGSNEPLAYAKGNSFYNNTVIDCSNYRTGCCGYSSITVNGQESLSIHDNTINLTGRELGSNGTGIAAVFTKGLKVYNNTIINDPLISEEMGNNNAYTFSLELWEGRGGTEIYDNKFYNGTIDIGGSFQEKGTYEYSISLHDNFIGRTEVTSLTKIGIIMESKAHLKDVLIYNNLIQNVSQGVVFYPSQKSEYSNIYLYYNILDQIGIDYTGSNHSWALWQYNNHPGSAYSFDNIHILNNIFNAASIAGNIQEYAMNLFNEANCSVTNVYIRNNIFTGWDEGAIIADAGGTIDNLSINNNIFFQNGNDNNPVLRITPSQYSFNNNLKTDPLFVSLSDFHLQGQSPAIGNGLKISQTDTDFEGKNIQDPPSIGVYEYSPSKNYALEYIRKGNVTVYPNPANEFLNISIQDSSNPDKIRIIDFSGKIIFEEKLVAGLNRIHIPKYIKPSVYLVAIVEGPSTIVLQKLVIIR